MQHLETAKTREVSKLASPEDVYEIVEFIRQRSSQEDSQWLYLDFSRLCQQAAARTDPHWIEILANELMGELSDARLIVRPPANPRGRTNLERAGMSFAIKQRPHDATDVRSTTRFHTWPANDWSGTWRPNDDDFRRRLFDLPREPDILVDRKFAIFLNPHVFASEGDLEQELSDNQAKAWIEGIVRRNSTDPRDSGPTRELNDDEAELITGLHDVTYELVSNLRYAFQVHNTTASKIASHRQRSYVQFYVTRGGTNSFNRLHFVVADLGYGIVETFLPKLHETNAYDYLGPADVIRRLLTGNLPEFGSAAGGGYRAIVDVVKQFKGELRLTTGSFGRSDSAGVVRARLSMDKMSDLPQIVSEDDPRLRFMGTTAHVIIPLSGRQPSCSA